MVLRMFPRARKRAIMRRLFSAERWPSGRRHQIANLAYWVTGTEGSNPSLSARFLHFLASSIGVKPLSKLPRWPGWGQGGVDLRGS